MMVVVMMTRFTVLSTTCLELLQDRRLQQGLNKPPYNCLAILLLLLSIGVEVAVGGTAGEVRKVQKQMVQVIDLLGQELARQEQFGQQLAQMIGLLGDIKHTTGGGGSGGSGGSGISRQAPEAGTYVPGVCPVIAETGTKRTACHDVETNGISGVYTVNIAGTPTRVYCDMSADGGGWMVIQRRMNGKVNFLRNWANYSNGFGDPAGEVWLGLEPLYKLTNSGSYQLRIDMADQAGTCRYVNYGKFRIESEEHEYRLESVGAYTGNGGNSFTAHVGLMFSTPDQDHDTHATWNCAERYTGCWWMATCHPYTDLNGVYGDNTHARGVNWYHFKGWTHSLPFTEMKIRLN